MVCNATSSVEKHMYHLVGYTVSIAAEANPYVEINAKRESVTKNCWKM